MRNAPLPSNLGILHTTTKRVFIFKINGRSRVLEFSFAKAIDADLVEHILKGDATKVSEAINHGADVNAEENNIEKRSPIHFATIQTNPKIIDILKQQKADLHKLRSDRFKACDTISLGIACRHPLLMCLSSVIPNNKVIAKALLKHMPALENEQWYPNETRFHAKIAKLREDISSNEEEKVPANQAESPDEINRLFYRLKATFWHNRYLLASTTLAGCIAVCTNISSAVAFTLTASTLSIVFGIQYFTFFRFQDEKYYLDNNDIVKGMKFAWDHGVKNAIGLIYHAPRYESPSEYRGYTYTPGFIVPANIARTL